MLLLRVPATLLYMFVAALILFALPLTTAWGFSTPIVTTLRANTAISNAASRRRQQRRNGAAWFCASSLAETTNDDDDSSITWYDATILSTTKACPSGKSLLWNVQVPERLWNDYVTAGQFLKLRRRKNKGNNSPSISSLFLAMSSPPGSATFEFLVKTTPNIPWLTDVLPGETVQVSDIMGQGFCGLSELIAQNIIMVAAGSGIAPFKACIESGVFKNFQTCRLYYGEWSMEDVCFQSLYNTENWQNVDVIPCLSQLGSSQGRSGYVQDVLQLDGLGMDYQSSTVALICGMDEMQMEVIELLKAFGVDEKRILTNL